MQTRFSSDLPSHLSSDAVLTDALGTVHTVASATPRIVCLVPSITELLCDLGLAPYIVGRTGFCIHPASVVATIPKVGGTKDVNQEKIRQLAPTHLIVNVDENEKPTVERLAASIPHVIVTHPLSPHDNLALYRLLGAIFQVSEAAERLCVQLEEALAQLPAPTSFSRVLYCIWQDPWMTVSPQTYIARMLALAGWQTWSPPERAERYPVFSWDSATLQQIDMVMLSTEPYRFTEAHADALEKQLGKPVCLLDGEMISWYGSRAIAGVRYLRELQQQFSHHSGGA